jgi:hypothetical protein
MNEPVKACKNGWLVKFTQGCLAFEGPAFVDRNDALRIAVDLIRWVIPRCSGGLDRFPIVKLKRFLTATLRRYRMDGLGPFRIARDRVKITRGTCVALLCGCDESINERNARYIREEARLIQRRSREARDDFRDCVSTDDRP